MYQLSHIALALIFASFTAHAADPAPAPIKPVQSVPTSAGKASVEPRMSQQDKMRECSKQATGKKGDERRSFMKTCLSKKA